MVSREILTSIINTKKELDNISVIGNVDFGHTNPRITFPVGGEVYLGTANDKLELIIPKH
jgi:muramoyltetrapeptide carboxypeptidase